MEVHWEFKNKEATLGINHEAFAAFVNGRMLALARQEVDLLTLLARANGRIVTRQFLLNQLYPVSSKESEWGLGACVYRLRRKLANEHPDAAEFIQTEYGCGYKMSSPRHSTPALQVA